MSSREITQRKLTVRYGWWRVVSSGCLVKGFFDGRYVWIDGIYYLPEAFEWLGRKGNTA